MHLVSAAILRLYDFSELLCVVECANDFGEVDTLRYGTSDLAFLPLGGTDFESQIGFELLKSGIIRDVFILRNIVLNLA